MTNTDPHCPASLLEAAERGLVRFALDFSSSEPVSTSWVRCPACEVDFQGSDLGDAFDAMVAHYDELVWDDGAHVPVDCPGCGCPFFGGGLLVEVRPGRGAQVCGTCADMVADGLVSPADLLGEDC